MPAVGRSSRSPGMAVMTGKAPVPRHTPLWRAVGSSPPVRRPRVVNGIDAELAQHTTHDLKGQPGSGGVSVQSRQISESQGSVSIDRSFSSTLVVRRPWPNLFRCRAGPLCIIGSIDMFLQLKPTHLFIGIGYKSMKDYMNHLQ